MQYLPSPRAWNRIGTRLVILLSLQAIVFPAEAQISPEVVAPAKRIELTPAKTPAEVRPSTPLILKLGNLKTYRQPNNLFSIDVPETWQIENFSQPNRIKLQWQDLDRETLICIELVRVSRKFTQAELGEELTKILKRGSIVLSNNPMVAFVSVGRIKMGELKVRRPIIVAIVSCNSMATNYLANTIYYHLNNTID
jgi:hypothetical protein